MSFKIIPFHVQLLVVFSLLFLINQPLQANEKKFTILHTTDEHSQLLPTPLADYHAENSISALGGYARLATKVEKIRADKSASNEPVLLFSSGDIIGGSPFAWLVLQNEAAELEIMKHIGYDAMTIGNHEFDYGPEILANYFKQAGFDHEDQSMSIISSNILIPEDHLLGNIHIEANKVYELSNGLRIGVFGLMGEESANISVYAAPVEFSHPIQSARRQVSKLREKGVDVIVAITHSGIEEDRKLAQHVAGIDIILGGHNHIQTEKPELINQTYIFHSGYYLRTLGKLEFEYNDATKELKIVNEENNTPFLIKLDDSVAEDLHVKEMVNAYAGKLNQYIAFFTDSLVYDIQQATAKSAFPLVRSADISETNIGNFLTDAMRLTTGELLGKRVDFAFQANGVIRSNIIPAQSGFFSNQITFFDLATVSGLGSGPDLNPGYPLVSFYLTAQEIIHILEMSAMLSQVYDRALFFQVSGIRSRYNLGRSLHVELPGIGLPLMTNRAVMQVEKFTGEGVQNGDDYVRLNPHSNKLYHVVADYFVLSFLPAVSELLPHLSVELKDENGNLIHPDDAIIYINNRELKVWDVLTRYALSFEEENSIPPYYESTQDRISLKKGLRYYLFKPIISMLK